MGVQRPHARRPGSAVLQSGLMAGGASVHIESRDGEVSPEVYARMVALAVETRVRLMLDRLPEGAVLRSPGAVADAVAAFVVAELARSGR